MIKGMEVRLTEPEKAHALRLMAEVLDRGWLMMGPMQEQLQERFCEMTGRKYAVTFNSNTSAMEALFLLDAERKPERVAFIANHYPSPVFAARRCGAEIVWCDFDPVTLSPSREHLEALGEVSSLVVQETAGFLPNWPVIDAWADDLGVLVVEDCGQSVGSQDAEGHYAGSFGDMAVFSLAGTKAMTTGQGGVVVTDDEGLAEGLFELKNAGRREMFTFDFTKEGWNTHMTELQAALGLAMFETMVSRREERAAIGKVYDAGLPDWMTRCGNRSGSPNWFKYPVLLAHPGDRKRLTEQMAEHEIGLASPVYAEPSYRFGVWRSEFMWTDLPGAQTFTSACRCTTA